MKKISLFASLGFTLLAFFFATVTFAGGGPVEFSVEPNTSLNPGEQYVVHARVYANGPYSTYCKKCYIKLAFKNPQEGDYIAQDSEYTNEEGRIYAKVISKVSGERIIIVPELRDSDGVVNTQVGSYVALRYTGESQFLKTPTNLRITQVETTSNPNTRKVHIFWDPVPGATSYTVYKPMGGINFYHTTVDTNLYEMEVSTSSTFYIAVAARKDGMESARSEVLTIDLAKEQISNNPTQPPATINAWLLHQELVGGNKRNVTVKWGAFDGYSGTFKIYAKTTSNKNDWEESFDGSKGPSAQITLRANQDYHIKVSGCMDKWGTCVDSNTLTLLRLENNEEKKVVPTPVVDKGNSEDALNQKVASLEVQLNESRKQQNILSQRVNDLVNFIKSLFPFFK